MKTMMSELRVAVVATFSLAVVLCGVYPLGVWLISQGLFPHEADGSLIQRGGTLVGSERSLRTSSVPSIFTRAHRPQGKQALMPATRRAATWGRFLKN